MTKGARQQEQLLNDKAGTQLDTSKSLYGKIMGQAQSMWDNPVSPANWSINAQQRAGATRMQNRAAASHNTAGLVSGEDQLARQSGQLAGEAATGASRDALGVEQSLYAPTLGSATNLYGSANEALKQRTRFGGITTPWGGVGGTG